MYDRLLMTDFGTYLLANATDAKPLVGGIVGRALRLARDKRVLRTVEEGYQGLPCIF